MDKFYHDYLEEMYWLEKKPPYIPKDYQPLQEE